MLRFGLVPHSRLPRPFSRRAFLGGALVTGAGLLLPRTSWAAEPPLFEEIPASVTGLVWTHENAMSPDRYLLSLIHI